MVPSGGSTVTYTASGSVESVKVYKFNEITVEYCHGPGGQTGSEGSGGNGGRVANATIDLSSIDKIYIWVGRSDSYGRYSGAETLSTPGGGSSEISINNTDENNSSDEPFLVAAGGGGGSVEVTGSLDIAGDGGARGGTSKESGSDAAGNPPPLGGTGGDLDNESGTDGEGAIDDQNRGLVSGGTTTKGGGSPQDTDGEIKITYPSIPSAPSNLTVEVTE